MIDYADYAELGLACSDVCTTLDRGLNGKGLNDLNSSVCEAINTVVQVSWGLGGVKTTPFSCFKAREIARE